MIHIANKTYEVVVDHKNGWKPEAFRDRYSEVLERYDFIVGDWGYNQLRLRGFFKDTHPKATKESSIATLQDYLNEYCNFGCAYFIIEKVSSKQQNGQHDSEPAGEAEESRQEPKREDQLDVEQPERLEKPERPERAERQERNKPANDSSKESNSEKQPHSEKQHAPSERPPQQQNQNQPNRKNNSNGSNHRQHRNHHKQGQQRQAQHNQQHVKQ
ncbi:YutD family protein [Paenibacillus doosanensis]|uniref:YutD family protein n=1 Tax=Paenibacillus doosanensis TaxID=1229154 RepID=UPI00218098E2|nr:YutD family protein [Paenibacillus doosanensis]MCS7463518.1 YutD family protein [Paenibacillus doosanensis]